MSRVTTLYYLKHPVFGKKLQVMQRNKVWPYTGDKAINTTDPERSQMLALQHTDFKSVMVGVFKQLKETMSEELF